MAIVLKDRVKVTSGVTGTGTATLGAAAPGFQDFSAVGDGNTTYYTIALQSGNEWEVGLGTVSYAGGVWHLSRDTVLSSSAGGTLVAFTAGTKDVFVTYPAEKAIYEEATGNVLIDGGPITVVGSGVTSYTSFTAVLGEMYGDVDSFAQFYSQNYSDGTEASGDFVVYRNDATNDTSKFVDMGINSSNYSSTAYPIFSPGSAYTFNDGGEMFFGSATDDVVIFAGGVDTTDEAARFDKTTKALTTASDVNVGGALTATGAAEFQSTVLLSADPTLNLQAATKQYVDNVASLGIIIHPSVRVESIGNLNATYNNGTAGVGATLTNAGTQTALVLDGVSVSVGDRVLVMDQTAQAQNGVYTVTNVGSGSTNWVLTRATDADSYGVADANQLAQGSYFYIQEGLTAAGESYVCSTPGTIVFGTTAITFSQFSAAPAFTGGTNIDVTGQVISLTGTVAPTNGGTGVNTVTTGDMLYGSATNTWSKLPIGAIYKPMVVDSAGIPSWNALALNQSGTVSGALPATNGGTGLSTYTLGDIVYSDAANSLAKLAGNTTATKLFLTQTGTGSASAAPAWSTISASNVSGLAPSATTDTTNAANISSGTLPSARLNGSYTGITGVGTLAAGTWNGSTVAAAYGGTGQSSYTVGDLLYADTSSSLAKLADVASGNALLSGGVGTAPAWGKIGLTTHVSGTLAVANGGTGATTLTGYVYGNGTGAFTASTSIPNSATTATNANTASAIVARDASGNFSAGTITATLNGNASTATSATSATTATNLAGGTAGAVPYQSSAGATAFSAAGTSGQYLQSNGTAAPSWVTPPTIGNGTLTLNVSGTGLSGSQTFTANQTGNATFTVTSNATSLNNASTIVARDGSGNFSAGTITATLSGNATTATSSPKVSTYDLRSTALTPSYFGQGLNTAFMANSTDGLSDGGTYHGVIQFQQWNDASGGGAAEIAITDNNNVWHRGSSGGLSSWSTWYKFLDSGNYSSYALPLSGGTLSGSVTYSGDSFARFGPNSSWGAYLRVGGNGRVSTTDATVATTDGNLHLDSADGHSIYLNYYAGGTVYGPGGSIMLSSANYGNYLAGNYMRAIGYASSSNDWNSLGNTYPNTVEQVDPTNFSGTTNGPTSRGYSYGTLLNFYSQSSSQAQVYISHAGNDLIFRGGWGGGSWQTWNRVLTDQNYTSYVPGLSTSNTWTAANYFQSNLGAYSGSLSNPPLQAYCTGGNSAFMSFHRGGNYAVNMGLDADNVLRIGGWSAASNRFQMDMSGNLTMAGNVTAYSDERLKKDWAPVADQFVEQLATVKSGTYTRVDSNERQAGSSAQDWQKLLPEVVSADADGTLALAYGNAALVAAIELAKRVVEQEARIAKLEALVAKLTKD